MEIYLKGKQNTKACEDTMKIDIENINTIENRKKYYTTKWRTIYEVIEPYFFKKRTDIFPDNFIKQYKDNAKEAQFVPIKVK